MKRKWNVRIFAVLCLITLVFSGAQSVRALSTADAVEPIDVTKTCTVTLTYKTGDILYEGLEIEIYQVADVDKDFCYSPAKDFKDYPIVINGLKAKDEWDLLCSTLVNYVQSDAIAPKETLPTDANGVVSFKDLPVGLYLVRWTGNDIGQNVSGFAPFLIAALEVGEDGKWIYEVSALPKPGKSFPTGEKLTVTKLWKEGKKKNKKRPASIEATIYRNGVLFETVTLSSENNWTYTWDTNGSYTWAVIETVVPDGYTVTVEYAQDAFQITNSIGGDDPPPVLGDTANAGLWIVLMIASGSILLLLGAFMLCRESKQGTN